MVEWKRVRLGEVADIKTGKLNSCAAVENGRYPFFTCAEKPLRIDTPAYDSESIFVAGNCTPYVNYYKGKFNAYQRTYIITPHGGVNGRWLYYFMTREIMQMIHRQQGTVEKYFVLSDFTDLEIPLPPLSTQKKIAAVLGVIDDKIEANRKICANLEAQAQALFNAAMRRKTSEPFTSNIDILSGGTPKTSVATYWGGDIPFFSPKDIGYPYAISTERSITKDGLNNCNSALYGKDTTFVTARGTVGKVCLAGVPMAMNQSCFALASYKLDPLLVYFYAKAAMNSLRWKANGSVFDAITVAEFETENIVRLTDEEESTFVRLVRPMFDTILSKIKESRALASMRDALLPKLMSGEIDVEKVEVA